MPVVTVWLDNLGRVNTLRVPAIAESGTSRMPLPCKAGSAKVGVPAHCPKECLRGPSLATCSLSRIERASRPVIDASLRARPDHRRLASFARDLATTARGNVRHTGGDCTVFRVDAACPTVFGVGDFLRHSNSLPPPPPQFSIHRNHQRGVLMARCCMKTTPAREGRGLLIRASASRHSLRSADGTRVPGVRDLRTRERHASRPMPLCTRRHPREHRLPLPERAHHLSAALSSGGMVTTSPSSGQARLLAIRVP